MTITAEGGFEVSRRIRGDYDNRRRNYDLASNRIAPTASRHPAPDRASLE